MCRNTQLVPSRRRPSPFGVIESTPWHQYSSRTDTTDALRLDTFERSYTGLLLLLRLNVGEVVRRSRDATEEVA